MVEKIILLAVILAFGAGTAAGESPPAPRKPPSPPTPAAAGNAGKGTVRLDEVRITGSPEHPGVLFFLPRPRFRLLPPAPEAEGKESFLRNDIGKGALQP
jgi:hypothetical protein